MYPFSLAVFSFLLGKSRERPCVKGPRSRAGSRRFHLLSREPLPSASHRSSLFSEMSDQAFVLFKKLPSCKSPFDLLDTRLVRSPCRCCLPFFDLLIRFVRVYFKHSLRKCWCSSGFTGQWQRRPGFPPTDISVTSAPLWKLRDGRAEILLSTPQTGGFPRFQVPPCAEGHAPLSPLGRAGVAVSLTLVTVTVAGLGGPHGAGVGCPPFWVCPLGFRWSGGAVGGREAPAGRWPSCRRLSGATGVCWTAGWGSCRGQGGAGAAAGGAPGSSCACVGAARAVGSPSFVGFGASQVLRVRLARPPPPWGQPGLRGAPASFPGGRCREAGIRALVSLPEVLPAGGAR